MKKKKVGDKEKAISIDAYVDETEKKGTPNKQWVGEHIEHLFHVLVDGETRKNKSQKKYKACSINRVVVKVNLKFGESYTNENVNNHLLCWKKKLVLIC